MGIPHLITHLRAYAVAGDLTGKAVIIDGPSFAYRMLDRRSIPIEFN